MQLDRGRDVRVVGRVADAAIVKNDDLVSIGQAPRQIAVTPVAVSTPAAHAQDRIARADNFVIHVVIVESYQRHQISPRMAFVCSPWAGMVKSGLAGSLWNLMGTPRWR